MNRLLMSLIGLISFVLGGGLVATVWAVKTERNVSIAKMKNGNYELYDSENNRLVLMDINLKGFVEYTIFNKSGMAAYIRCMNDGPPGVMNAVIQVETKAGEKKTLQILNPDYNGSENNHTINVSEIGEDVQK
jgi:hypothetical protein